MSGLQRNLVMVGDAAKTLKTLPPESIDCIVTSPPYYMLRNYGVENQIGLEPNVELWVDEMRLVCRGLARTLKDSGSLWLNLGDSFSRHSKYGAPAKGLLAAPERLLLGLLSDGWICRGKVIWAKPNPMPSSVRDRLNMTYEVVYHLVRSPRYYFNLDLIREPHRSSGRKSAGEQVLKAPAWAGPLAGKQDGLRRARPEGLPGHVLGKNPGDVWWLPTKGFRGPHFATFPEGLVTRPLLATCPEAICTRCGEPWMRKVTRERTTATGNGTQSSPNDRLVHRYRSVWSTLHTIGELVPCGCGAPTRPGVVLDPFFGSGTVGVVAEKLERNWIGIELNPEYAELARRRLKAERGKRKISTNAEEQEAA
jgi:DNA modification methylase